MSSGIRNIDGVQVLPLDGLWQNLDGLPAEEKLVGALEYAGCNFLDEEQRFVAGHVISLAGFGGVPIAHQIDADSEIKEKLDELVTGTREMMGSSAAFSYLNVGERDINDLYDKVTSLGHISIAHTVYLNFVVAGISEGAELELNLQRDIVHISKVTNARTKVQNSPPLVVRDPENVAKMSDFYERVRALAAELRTDETGDTLELANSVFPINKATILMISGDLSNLRKFALIREDEGKERELRDVANGLYEQLRLLWPEIVTEKE
jgi:hypothetical protein